MLKLPDIQIEFPILDDFAKNQFALVDGQLGRAQRDNIADQIQADIDLYSLSMYWEKEPRHHLGASVIGHYCNRYIWMHFRWVLQSTPAPRMTRLWYRGHREEDVSIAQLRGIGCTVLEIQDNGKQIQIARDSADGHFGGSLDALIQLPTRYGLPPFWSLLELKTVGSKYWKDLTGVDVYKARDKHFKQQCIYAYKISQLGTYGEIKYSVYHPVNKDNDELDIQFLELDHTLGKEEVEKAEVIARQYYPPVKHSQDANFWECKICPMHEICHLGKPYYTNCRSCKFAEPVADGQWKCHHHNAIIPKEFLIKGCEAWESLPR